MVIPGYLTPGGWGGGRHYWLFLFHYLIQWKFRPNINSCFLLHTLLARLRGFLLGLLGWPLTATSRDRHHFHFANEGTEG